MTTTFQSAAAPSLRAGCLSLLVVPLATLLVIWTVQNNWFPRTWSVARALRTSTDGRVFAAPNWPRERALFSEETWVSAYTTVDVRQLADGHVMQHVPAPKVGALALSPNHQWLATSGPEQHIQVWRLADGVVLHDVQHNDPQNNYNREVESIVFSPDGQYLASAGGDITKLWRIADGALLHTFTDVNARALAFSPDSSLLAAADNFQIKTPDGWRYSVRLWRVSDQQEVRVIPVEEQPTSLAFSPDGQWLAVGLQSSAFYPGHVRVWRVNGTDPTPTYDFARSQWVFAVAWSPDGRYLAAGGASYAATGWAIGAPSWLHAPQRLAVWYMDGPFRGWQAQSIWTSQESSRALAFTPDGSHLVSGGGELHPSFKVFRFVPLPAPPIVLAGSSILVSLGLWARAWWRRRQPRAGE